MHTQIHDVILLSRSKNCVCNFSTAIKLKGSQVLAQCWSSCSSPFRSSHFSQSCDDQLQFAVFCDLARFCSLLHNSNLFRPKCNFEFMHNIHTVVGIGRFIPPILPIGHLQLWPTIQLCFAVILQKHLATQGYIVVWIVLIKHFESHC